MRRTFLWLGTPLLLATAVVPARAQHRSPLPVPGQQAATQDQGSAGPAIGAGIGLGLVGFFVGGLTATRISSGCASSDYCGLAEAFYGAAAGGTLGMALGVHLGNKRRGSFALDFLTGAAVWGAGIGIAAASDWDIAVTTTAFITIPIAQLASTVAVERAVGRSRSRQRGVTMSIVPHTGGGVTLFGSVPF